MKRVETGIVQFGDDQPGVFIRGDNPMGYALIRDLLLSQGNIQYCESPPVKDLTEEEAAKLFCAKCALGTPMRHRSVCIDCLLDETPEAIEKFARDVCLALDAAGVPKGSGHHTAVEQVFSRIALLERR